jgi:hypothetical protein
MAWVVARAPPNVSAKDRSRFISVFSRGVPLR